MSRFLLAGNKQIFCKIIQKFFTQDIFQKDIEDKTSVKGKTLFFVVISHPKNQIVFYYK